MCSSLKDGEEWKLADFKLADSERSLVPGGKIAKMYLPPELQADDEKGYKSSGDVFCVGMLVSEFKSTDLHSEEMDLWVKRVTCLNEADRPSAAILLEELSGWLVLEPGRCYWTLCLHASQTVRNLA